jgi:3-deoxy-D-manno-octulosonic acid (KDO) 8-phosphate synthase
MRHDMSFQIKLIICERGSDLPGSNRLVDMRSLERLSGLGVHGADLSIGRDAARDTEAIGD